jgi:hypothetical protein
MNTLSPKFVNSILRREQMDNGVIYISMEYSTAIHKCACGCGNEVVTPFSPTDWELIFDGTVSLYPSIGNWSFPCQSHYWITKNRIKWAPKWTKKQIEEGRKQEKFATDQYYRNKKRKSLFDFFRRSKYER